LYRGFPVQQPAHVVGVRDCGVRDGKGRRSQRVVSDGPGSEGLTMRRSFSEGPGVQDRCLGRDAFNPQQVDAQPIGAHGAWHFHIGVHACKMGALATIFKFTGGIQAA